MRSVDLHLAYVAASELGGEGAGHEAFRATADGGGFAVGDGPADQGAAVAAGTQLEHHRPEDQPLGHLERRPDRRLSLALTGTSSTIETTLAMNPVTTDVSSPTSADAASRSRLAILLLAALTMVCESCAPSRSTL